MTFAELVKAVKRETHIGLTKEQIRDVLICAIRVSIEEFMVDKAFADINLTGIGKFTLKRRMGERYEKKYDTWSVHFKQSSILKDVLNDRKPIEDLTVGNYYLYPNLHNKPVKNDKLGMARKSKAPNQKTYPFKKRKPVEYTDTMNCFRADARTRKLREEQRQKEAREQRKKNKKRNYNQLIPDEDE